MTLHENEMEVVADLGRRWRHEIENNVLIALGAKPLPPLPPRPKCTRDDPVIFKLDPPEACCPHCWEGLVKEVRKWMDGNTLTYVYVHVDSCPWDSKEPICH